MSKKSIHIDSNPTQIKIPLTRRLVVSSTLHTRIKKVCAELGIPISHWVHTELTGAVSREELRLLKSELDQLVSESAGGE